LFGFAGFLLLIRLDIVQLLLKLGNV